MQLSVIITSRDDTMECIQTCHSIRETVGSLVEIIIVDDASKDTIPGKLYDAQVIKMERRVGVGPARTVGALHASGTHLLFVDSHMRFKRGWYEAAYPKLESRPNTAHCGSCIGLSRQNMSLLVSRSKYYGATFDFYGPDPAKKNKWRVFECVWKGEEPGDDYEIPAMMGACYFFPKDWFLKLNPLRHFRSYGTDEASLSLKCWLAGGEIRFLKNVEIGHQFREKGIALGEMWHAYYNKLFAIYTLLPKTHAEMLDKKMRGGGLYAAAKKSLYDDWHLVEVERAYNRSIFCRDFAWFLDKFKLSFPVI